MKGTRIRQPMSNITNISNDLQRPYRKKKWTAPVQGSGGVRNNFEDNLNTVSHQTTEEYHDQLGIVDKILSTSYTCICMYIFKQSITLTLLNYFRAVHI